MPLPSLGFAFPLWLKCLYKIAQMELTTLDPLGACYLVALDTDWNLRPQNINPNGTFRARPTITMPAAYPPTATAGRIGAYSIASRNFELQQRVTVDLNKAETPATTKHLCHHLVCLRLNNQQNKHDSLRISPRS